MIAKKNRFHGHASLNYLYRHGKTVRAQYFGVKYVHNQKRQHYRLAVVVSKKIASSAVVRNRIRRRIFEQLRIQLGDLSAHTDMVVTVYDVSVAEMPTDQLQKMLNDTLVKIADRSPGINVDKLT